MCLYHSGSIFSHLQHKVKDIYFRIQVIVSDILHQIVYCNKCTSPTNSSTVKNINRNQSNRVTCTSNSYKLFDDRIISLSREVRFRLMVFNATFNKISVVSCLSVLLVEEARIPEHCCTEYTSPERDSNSQRYININQSAS